MAGLRPGRTHTRLKRPFTRISKHKPRKSYVKGVPQGKIFHFHMSDTKDSSKLPVLYHLVSKGALQLRSNCLESARMAVNDHVRKNATHGYIIKMRAYPHQILREKPMATGAGADRFSQGMRRSFGKPIGVAARVRVGQKIISVWMSEGKDAIVKEALRRASMKLSGLYRIEKG